MNIDTLVIGRFAEWLPLDGEMPPEELARWIVEQVPKDPRPADGRLAIAKHLVVLRDQLYATSGPGMHVFAAWVLLPQGGTVLDPRAAITGALMTVPSGIDASQLVDVIIGDTPLYQPPEVTELATGLGPASLIRGRAHQQTDQGLALSEIASVAWLVEDEVALVLTSLPNGDLVLAQEVADAMSQLAVAFSQEDGRG